MAVRSVRWGLIATAALFSLTACGSSGSPAAQQTPAGGSGQPPASISASPSGPASGAGVGAVAGDFCGVFSGLDVAKLSQAKDSSGMLAVWDKATASAPSEIRADMQTIDNYMHAVVKGDYQSVQTGASSIATAAGNLGTYFAAHCHG